MDQLVAFRTVLLAILWGKSSSFGGSSEAEEGQDRHDHDDEADEVDDSVHVLSPLSGAAMAGQLARSRKGCIPR
tara:strand:- start:312 stop:533 length:222 start_codon:yes stop_codon:yes gene_type:complete